MTQTRRGNGKLAAVIGETRWSHAQVANAFRRVAAESGARELAAVGRSHVSHWVAGSTPSGWGPVVLAEALSRRLGRIVTVEEIGLATHTQSSRTVIDWDADTLVGLTELGRTDVDPERRHLLATSVYSLTALALPAGPWWTQMAARGSERVAPGSRAVGGGDLEAVREMASMFSRIEQRRGGGHARTAVVQYLNSDVANCLRGTYADKQVRKAMFSTASELAYLAGWTAFDNSEHTIAQHYFTVAVKLAAEADDAPMVGHILRAMAHRLSIWVTTSTVSISLPHLWTANVTSSRARVSVPCSASFTQRRSVQPDKSKPQRRPCYKPKGTSPRQAQVTRNRHACSSSAKPALPTKRPARCVIPEI